MKFEKVSLETFRKDLKKIEPYFTEELIETAYTKIRIPERATAGSAGYDFVTPVRIYLPPKRDIRIPTGIKCFFSAAEAANWHLKLYPRSSLGIKQKVVLTNCTGIIDADYYNNPENEGDIMLSLYNFGNMGVNINAGDKVMQGIFEAYAITDDDRAEGLRTGGIGSTGR